MFSDALVEVLLIVKMETKNLTRRINFWRRTFIYKKEKANNREYEDFFPQCLVFESIHPASRVSMKHLDVLELGNEQTLICRV